MLQLLILEYFISTVDESMTCLVFVNWKLHKKTKKIILIKQTKYKLSTKITIIFRCVLIKCKKTLMEDSNSGRNCRAKEEVEMGLAHRSMCNLLSNFLNLKLSKS